MNYIKKNVFYLILLTAIFIGFTYANANMIWPGVYIAQGVVKYYIIILNFIISILFVKKISNETSKKSIILTSLILIVLLSLAGTIVIPICGLVGELIFSVFNIRTFGLISWLINYSFAVAFYALVDSVVFKLILESSIKKTYLSLFGYNMITIGLAIIEILVIHPNQIMF